MRLTQQDYTTFSLGLGKGGTHWGGGTSEILGIETENWVALGDRHHRGTQMDRKGDRLSE
ncbi:MAG TPA: hypothetical protein V6D27_13465 [Vampirovibrionales bacterium]